MDFLYERVSIRWGKVRPLMLLGWAIQTIGLLCMFNFFSIKSHGVPVFLLSYMVYVIGYTSTPRNSMTCVMRTASWCGRRFPISPCT